MNYKGIEVTIKDRGDGTFSYSWKSPDESWTYGDTHLTRETTEAEARNDIDAWMDEGHK